MNCPNCSATTRSTCNTCGGDGTVPNWLTDPDINGETAARTWGWDG